MNIQLIWAQDTNAAIGKDGTLPWDFSEDLKNRSIVSQSREFFSFFKNLYSEKYCEYILTLFMYITCFAKNYIN